MAAKKFCICDKRHKPTKQIFQEYVSFQIVSLFRFGEMDLINQMYEILFWSPATFPTHAFFRLSKSLKHIPPFDFSKNYWLWLQSHSTNKPNFWQSCVSFEQVLNYLHAS